MPTVSASQALKETNSTSSSRPALTGLNKLDDLSQSKHDPKGVLSRGHVTEIYGPPGVGKTALA